MDELNEKQVVELEELLEVEDNSSLVKTHARRKQEDGEPEAV